jgi:predicted Fe-S protein YdhL (DUF1289 family)
MARFPKIQSPCPYKADLAAIMDGEFCRMCKRQVFDITDWTDGERVDFLAGCKEEVCVSYRIVRPALAAAALAAVALPTAAAAQTTAPAPAPVVAVTADEIGDAGQEVEITGGGITDPGNVEFLSEDELAAIPEAPVTYEDEAPAPAPAAKPGA